MIGHNAGQWMILVLCCVWPLICSILSILAYRRYQRRGLGSFFPKIRTAGDRK